MVTYYRVESLLIILGITLRLFMRGAICINLDCIKYKACV
jgi:hypothetical protein